MDQIPADQLLPDELAALMHFYAEAGVGWLGEDEPIDRFAEFVALSSAKKEARTAPAALEQPQQASAERPSRRPERAEARPAAPPAVAIPDAEAVEAAVRLAAAAESPEALIEAVNGFGGCNLRNSARNTVFAGGDLSARIAVIGGVPSADDDREGAPFSGPAGVMLSRMLAGIGLDSASVLSFNLIPWRTPGDRAPTVREVEICLPFGMRLLELVRPQAVLVLGNLPVRVLSKAAKGSIHSLRGKWFDIADVPGLATFHPQEMITAPTCKGLAWQDILRFRAEMDAPPQRG
ncbi:uracil-DNA glycosylase [Rhizobium sp. LjRoot254]|uniref:uracil-DNA glycosylase n=1 Tax=Rhizobium sp. LjRoot254 TaxID=3342297 RepID=UPI003ECED36C